MNKNNVSDGPHLVYHPDGKLAESYTFKQGRLTGLGSEWYIYARVPVLTSGVRHPNGQLEAKVYFVNGEREGLYTLWHDNGTRAEVSHYDKGLLHGRQRKWNASGKLVYSMYWENGVSFESVFGHH